MKPSTIVSLDPQLAQTPDGITVFLRDCNIDLRVGHNADERTKSQRVIISLEAQAALPHRYQDIAENSLDRVIDYSRFYDYITQELPKLGHIALLETVAEQIVAFAFQDRRILKVRVRIEKPEIYGENARAGIEVYRNRPTGAV